MVHANEYSQYHRMRFAEAALDPQKMQDVKDLCRLPTLTKKELFENHGELVTNRPLGQMNECSTFGFNRNSPEIPTRLSSYNAWLRRCMEGTQLVGRRPEYAASEFLGAARRGYPEKQLEDASQISPAEHHACEYIRGL